MDRCIRCTVWEQLPGNKQIVRCFDCQRLLTMEQWTDERDKAMAQQERQSSGHVQGNDKCPCIWCRLKATLNPGVPFAPSSSQLDILELETRLHRLETQITKLTSTVKGLVRQIATPAPPPPQQPEPGTGIVLGEATRVAIGSGTSSVAI